MARVAAVGRPDDDNDIERFSFLYVDRRGRYYVASTGARDASVAVYRPDGTFLTRLGRPGRGPGEFEGLRHLESGGGDSLLVMDLTAMAVFSPSGVFVRERALPPGLQSFMFLALTDGRVVVNNWRHTRPALLLLDRGFGLVRAFGRSRADPRESDVMQFVLAEGAGGTIIAANVNHRYVIDVWDTTGTLRTRYVRNADWYPPWTGDQMLAAVPRPMPRITSLCVDAEGRLWLTGAVPDRRWQAPPGSSRGPEGGGVIPEVSELTRTYDTVIEVLDLRAGRVIVSQRLDALVRLLDNGMLAEMTEDDGGLLHYEISRAEVRRSR